MIGMEKNRSRQARARRLQKSLAATLKVLEAQLAALERDIDGAVRGPPTNCSPRRRGSATSPPAR